MNAANDNRPVFVSRKTAAGLMEMSVETFDDWVRQGFLPRAHVQRGQIYRWHWPTLETKLAGALENERPDEAWKMPEETFVRKRRNAKS